jgi:hypothetical protein
MAAQVIADIKPYGLLKTAADWFTFAASGPGSRRGLNRVLNRSVDSPWDEGAWRHELAGLHKAVLPYLQDMPSLDAQNLQNCLCEFDKYDRARLGQASPSSASSPIWASRRQARRGEQSASIAAPCGWDPPPHTSRLRVRAPFPSVHVGTGILEN